jgi:hypothetical protein
MSMVGPLGGDARDPGVPTTYVEDVNGSGDHVGDVLMLVQPGQGAKSSYWN